MNGHPDALLATTGLTLHVGGRSLVTGLACQVRAGEFWCLLGPNGAGKTWLLNALAGARAPDEGSVSVAGRSLRDWPPAELARWRAYAPQQVHDAFSAPVLSVVLMGRHPHLSRWQWESAADEALARQALARVGLAGFEARDVTSLSGGERQRVALATLLVQDAPLALLDEPLAHLDLAQQLRMLDLLAEEVRQRQRAVLMSVHDLRLAQRVASHVLLLAGDGRALAGPVAEVMTARTLSAAFGHQLHRVEAEGRLWWLPA